MKKLLLSVLALTLVVGCGNTDKKKDSNPSHEGHEYVDLGLSVKWATCNIGAENPEDYGNYYAWGETSTKSSYLGDNCTTWNKRMEDIKGTNHDVAFVEWGGNWRMPTKEEFNELLEKCEWERIGNGCYKVTGPNGNSIYLPAAGYRRGETLYYDVEGGGYWSSTPYSEYNQDAFRLNLGNLHAVVWSARYVGYPVRPVLE